ncbi:MAG: protoheme IX farnesyltransferase [Polyangiaceae bacterium]|nr:protoheme IX farnesyltransferase [Polyangiaceae bacterium]
MSSSARTLNPPRSVWTLARDVIALTKPRITRMVLFTAFGGYWLACKTFGVDLDVAVLIPLLGGTALVVSGANALNMYIERDSDGLMERTRNRPLPAGRLGADVALAVGVFCSAVSIPWLTFGVHPVTALFAAIALGSYVGIYTPMKRKSPAALLVGAVPGAIPPLLGWSAVRGSVDGPAIILFLIMFLWQVPHFLAIATFRKADYAAAGLKVTPVVRGERITRHHVVRYSAALVLVSLLLVPYGIGGDAYMIAALLLGAAFFGVAAWGLRSTAGNRWARTLFVSSMVYLMGIFIALTLSS